MKEISKDEFIKYNSKKETLKQDPEQETFLTTNDSTRYQIYKLSYNAIGDTIIFKGTKSITKGNIIPFSGKLAFADVKNFEVSAKNETVTWILTIGILAGGSFKIFCSLAQGSWFDHSKSDIYVQ